MHNILVSWLNSCNSMKNTYQITVVYTITTTVTNTRNYGRVLGPGIFFFYFEISCYLVEISFRLSNSKFRLSNSKFRLTISKFRLIISKFRLNNSKFRLINSNFRFSNSKFRLTISSPTTYKTAGEPKKPISDAVKDGQSGQKQGWKYPTH